MEKKNILTTVLGGLLLVGVVAVAVISVMSYSELKSLRKDYEALNSELDTSSTEMMEKREDGVKIADEYVIESTLPVSDAYKSKDSSKLSDAEKETLDMATTVVKETIKDGMTPYEKEKAIYDWMVTHITNGTGMLTVIPTTSQENACPHGVLKNHNAVCVGYATTFRLFMQMLDIPCKVVHNKEMYHSWDLVKLDKDWYHVDVYSDASGSKYSNFNLTDTMRQAGGETWDEDVFPSARGLKYNYAYLNKKDCKELYDLPKLMRNALKKKDQAFMVDFGKQLSEKEQAVATAMINGMESILMNADISVSGGTFGPYSWLQEPDTKDYLFNVSFTFPSSNNAAGSLSDKEIDKIMKAISKSFGDIGEPDRSMISGEGEM